MAILSVLHLVIFLSLKQNSFSNICKSYGEQICDVNYCKSPSMLFSMIFPLEKMSIKGTVHEFVKTLQEIRQKFENFWEIRDYSLLSTSRMMTKSWQFCCNDCAKKRKTKLKLYVPNFVSWDYGAALCLNRAGRKGTCSGKSKNWGAFNCTIIRYRETLKKNCSCFISLFQIIPQKNHIQNFQKIISGIFADSKLKYCMFIYMFWGLQVC